MRPDPKKCSDSGSQTLCDGVFCAVIAAFSFAISYLVIQTQLDVGPCDENSYALAGELWPNVRLLSNWAPLYSLWHSALLTVIPNRLDEYFCNFLILSAAFPALLFLLLRHLSIPRVSSAGLAIFFATAFPNLQECPRVSIFCIVLLLIALLLIVRCESKSWALAVGTVALWIVSYVRPEFALGAALLAVLFIINLRRESPREPLVRYAILALIAALPLLLLGSPLSDFAYGRSTEAFGQLYARTQAPPGSDYFSEWKQFVVRDYHTVPSLSEALRIDASRTISAIVSNLADTLPNGAVALSGNGPLTIRLFCLALLLFALLGKHGTAVSPDYPQKAAAMICIAAIVVSALASLPLAVIFPRKIFVVLVFAAVSLAVMLAARPGRGLPFFQAAACLGFAGLLLSVALNLPVPARRPRIELFRAFENSVALSPDSRIVICPSNLQGLLKINEYARTEKNCTLLFDPAIPAVAVVDSNCGSAERCSTELRQIEASPGEAGFSAERFDGGTILVRRGR